MQDAKSALEGTSDSSTGVYMGSVWQEYPPLLADLRIPDAVHALTGSGMNFMVGRVSYTFGLQGEPDICALVCKRTAHSICSLVYARVRPTLSLASQLAGTCSLSLSGLGTPVASHADL